MLKQIARLRGGLVLFLGTLLFCSGAFAMDVINKGDSCRGRRGRGRGRKTKTEKKEIKISGKPLYVLTQCPTFWRLSFETNLQWFAVLWLIATYCRLAYAKSIQISVLKESALLCKGVQGKPLHICLFNIFLIFFIYSILNHILHIIMIHYIGYSETWRWMRNWRLASCWFKVRRRCPSQGGLLVLCWTTFCQDNNQWRVCRHSHQHLE